MSWLLCFHSETPKLMQLMIPSKIVESQCAVDGDESVENGEEEMAVTVSHLNLVDLAGNEPFSHIAD